MKKIALIILWLSFQLGTHAQVLRGQVFQKDSGRPVAGASIFFDGMLKGASSDANGNFSLNISGMGGTPIVVSALGYSSTTISAYSAGSLLKVYLDRKQIELDQVVVSSSDGMSRKEKLEIFKTEFLGSSSNAKSCEILNEDDIMLGYNQSTQTLKASCEKPILIRNRNLGYIISYFLENFSYTNKGIGLAAGQQSMGYSMSNSTSLTAIQLSYRGKFFFEEDTLDRDDPARLEKRREATYLGSKMHFIRSLWNNSLKAEGFTVYESDQKGVEWIGIMPYEKMVVSQGPVKFLRAKGIFLHILARGNRQSSLKIRTDSAYIRPNGSFEPVIAWDGDMASQRTGDLLPFNYQSLIAPAIAPAPPVQVLQTNILRGRLLDADTDKPVQRASVFFDRMQRATASDTAGNFAISVAGMNNSPLIITALGYETARITTYSPGVPLDVYLKPKNIELNAVVISASDGMPRKEKLAIFRREFLGSSPNARNCEILNEDDIRLSYNRSTEVLTGSCDKPILIRNKNMGYTITYFLENFRYAPRVDVLPGIARSTDIFSSGGNSTITAEISYKGNFFFEEILTESRADRERIAKKRELAYQGSRLQLIRALWNNTLKEDGFIIYHNDVKVGRDEILAIHEKNIFLKTGHKSLEVVARGNRQSFMEILADSVPIYQNGFYASSQIAWQGDMLNERTGDLLPYSYRDPSSSGVADPVAAPAIAMDPKLEKLISVANTLTEKYPKEKVHLHLDKPYYTIGDTIWLKAYVVNAKDNTPSELSKIAYTELIDGQDSVRARLMLPLQAGMAQGDFVLTESLEEGDYLLRAYTNWMRNFGEDYFFNKNIRIGNSIESTVLADADYQFIKGQKENVTAAINYKTLSGEVLAGREVTYEIEVDGKIVSKGKGQTDGKGVLTAKFSQPELKTGLIRTSLKIDNKPVTKTVHIRPIAEDTDIQFFPEGGALVAGISSRVGFKATGIKGGGLDISGYVVEEATNQRVADFSTEHAGMGSFNLTPVAGSSYAALVKLSDGSERKVQLPKAASEGYALSAEQTDTVIAVSIQLSQNLADQGELTLIGQLNGEIEYAEKRHVNGRKVTISLPQSRVSEGILQLTLFSPADIPVAERLIFVKNENKSIKTTISSSKPAYGKREKVKLELLVTDSKNNPLQGNFSIAVTDDDKVPYSEQSETTIRSNLLLSSDLKGKVEDPNYYFTDPDPVKTRHLDNLLLTQGWRRFEWKEVLQEKYPTLSYNAEKTQQLSGRLTQNNGDAVPGGQVLLIGSGSRDFVISATTDAQGKYWFDSLGFTQKDKYTFQGSDAKGGKNVRVVPDRLPSPAVSWKPPVFDAESNSAFINYLENSYKAYNQLKASGNMKDGIILDAITVEARKIEEIRKVALANSKNPLGPGNADQVLTFVDMLPCKSSVSECLTTLGRGLRVIGNAGQSDGAIGAGPPPPGMPKHGEIYSLRRPTSMNQSIGELQPMLIVIDGIAATSTTELGAIVASELESIEVLQPGMSAIFGNRGKNGAIIVTTKRGKIDYSAFENKNMSNRSQALVGGQANGYYFGRVFYSPVYTNETASSVPDLRTTVYWNPDVSTNAEGKAEIEFFNSDSTGPYRVIAEGLTKDGELGRQVFRYNIK